MSLIHHDSHTVNMVIYCGMLNLLQVFSCGMTLALELRVSQRHHPSSEWKIPELP